MKWENGQPKERRSFSDELKYRAGQILAATRGRPSRWSPLNALEDELRLLLRHLYLAQRLEVGILTELLDRECDIGTELLALEHRTPRYATQRFPEREKIKRRLERVQRERRRFRERQAERLAGLEERLLQLLGRIRLVGGIRNDVSQASGATTIPSLNSLGRKGDPSDRHAGPAVRSDRPRRGPS